MKALSLFLVILPFIATAAEQSPYAGEEARGVKSLSEKEIAQLRSGAGMGLAKLAELNQYPGPKHVLELADQLDLNEGQLEATQELFASVKRDAIALGEQIVEAESELDQAFADADITAETLRSMTLEIGRLRAELRLVHLAAHLRQAEVLRPDQIIRYDELRGYGGHKEHRHQH